MVSENHLNLDWLLSMEGFDHYRNIGKEETVKLGAFTKSWGMKFELLNRKSVLIAHKKQPIGRYFALRTKLST